MYWHEGTQDNQVQEENNNVNMEDNKTKRKNIDSHCLMETTIQTGNFGSLFVIYG
jgi:hypothetical protein